jgi:hypothetical protein
MGRYQQKISRANPGLIIMALDDSGSHADFLAGTTDPKYQWNERYTGIILKELLSRSSEVSGQGIVIKPRYFLHVIEYGSQPQLWGDPVMDIETAVQKYTEAGNSLGLGGRLGGTDTAAALQMALADLQKVLADERFRNSFPPLLLHITDGESQTDATTVAEQIKQLATADGNVLMANAYIGTRTNLGYKGPEDFPGYVTSNEAGPSPDNLRLFGMSSEMPETIRQNLIDDAIFPNLREKARLFFDVRTKEMLKHVIQVVGSIGSRADRTQR